jgi:ergothioneine biosynthesis protein EgtB
MLKDDSVASTISEVSIQEALIKQYRTIRARSEALCQPLTIEDYVIQAMPDVSPPKWHLAHTTWFFENFVLRPYCDGYAVFDEQYGYLFNSYYEAVGRFFPRAQRGLLARPTVEDIGRYRAHVDRAMVEFLAAVPQATQADVTFRTTLGLHHEQQHQELLLTDIKYNFSVNPLHPVYRAREATNVRAAQPLTWLDFPGGLQNIGFGGEGFTYDNETPRHAVLLQDYRLASRPVTNGEYWEFIESGAYGRHEFWLSDGWATVRQQGWEAPLYWEKIDRQWWQMTLSGMRPVDENEPVCHVSFYEAEAYARFRDKRLPTEAEWECAAAGLAIQGNLSDADCYHPVPAPDSPSGTLVQMFGDVWEWTHSPYLPYPGFCPLTGALGEYNGKFMCNQWVLRGGSCVTPASHLRPSYRNFFYPKDRWQFAGIRLAEDAR